MFNIKRFGSDLDKNMTVRKQPKTNGLVSRQDNGT